MSLEEASTESVPVYERILTAAENVVTRDGVANLSLDAVAREAGVSKGGLLYHFPNKSALVTAIVERLASHCESEQAKAVPRVRRSRGHSLALMYGRDRSRAGAGGSTPSYCTLGRGGD